jgi:hypothetical protein
MAVAPAKKSRKPINRVNSLKPRKFVDHQIVNHSGRMVGHVRVKPSSILWSPTDGRDWYGIPLKKFAEYLELNGKKQKK